MIESFTFFNSGKGSISSSKGEVEMDASIMDGTTHKAGLVAGVKAVKHSITLARQVSEHTPHVMLIGEGTDTLGLSPGMNAITKEYSW